MEKISENAYFVLDTVSWFNSVIGYNHLLATETICYSTKSLDVIETKELEKIQMEEQ